jgi:hypothetical protein
MNSALRSILPLTLWACARLDGQPSASTLGPSHGDVAPRLPAHPRPLGGGLRGLFQPDGVTLTGPSTARMSLSAWGRYGALIGAAHVVPRQEPDRVVYARAGIEEWWEEKGNGLEQSFLVPAPPLGAGPLVLELAVAGAQVTVEGQRAWFAGLQYDGLRAWDETGRALPAWFEPSGGGLRVVVDDAAAEGAVWVDPFLSLGWSAESDQDNGLMGIVSSAGDVNGDGFDDVIVGAEGYSNGQTYEGRAYLYLGSAAGLEPAAAWTAESDQVGAGFGGAVSSAGDVNGDGYDDVVVAAPWYDGGHTDEGRVYLYLGSAVGLEPTAAWTAESDQDLSLWGYALSSAGDVNGDGYDDVVVGALWYDNGEDAEGRADLYLGSAVGLEPTPAWTTEGDQIRVFFGSSVSSAGDVNGDGYDDVVVAAPDYDDDDIDEGQAFLYLGSAAGLDTVAAWQVGSDQAYASLSRASSAGDVNGDGYDDVVVAATEYDNGQWQEGRASLFLGSASGLATVAAWTAESDQDFAYLGSVASAGDVNDDGYDDVMIGVQNYTNGEYREGRAYVYLGSAAGLDTVAAWTAESDQAEAYFARFLSSAGDVNGDGYDDVVVGARYYDNGQANEGRAQLYYGGCFDDLLDSDLDTIGDACEVCPGFDDLLDTDLDAAPDGCDDDDDNDSFLDADDSAPLDAAVCGEDADSDACDDCARGLPDPANDGVDTDSDGACDASDADDDNDTVLDAADAYPLDPAACGDTDADTCDDCTGLLPDPANDGADTDGDGACDLGDADDDNDTVLDLSDAYPLDAAACGDADDDGCEDCSNGLSDPLNDGRDTDSDGMCDVGDRDDDNDAVFDNEDTAPFDPAACGDTDADTCEDCANGPFDPANDGIDADSDGLCDAGDPDDDDDAVLDAADASPLDPTECGDTDDDACEDCANGPSDPANDGLDTDADGMCDLGDADDDGDSIPDATDPAPLDPVLCGDADADSCDDCDADCTPPADDPSFDASEDKEAGGCACANLGQPGAAWTALGALLLLLRRRRR